VESWIAESTTGGICVLLSPAAAVNGVHPIGATCTEGTVRLPEGTYLTYQYPQSDEVAIAGVAPLGTTAIRVTFADGTAQTQAVNDNAWALQTESPPTSITALPQGPAIQTGGQ